MPQPAQPTVCLRDTSLRRLGHRGAAEGSRRVLHPGGRYHFDGQTLTWEYLRAHPDGGDQVDLAEVMDLRGPQIAHHRIYWGWFGTPLPIHSTR